MTTDPGQQLSNGRGQETKLFEEDVTDSKISVLAVDDDPDVVDMTATFLEKEQTEFDVTIEIGAEAALERLREHPEAIDASVSDYDMPKLNGLEFLAEVRSEFGDLPFILFTSKGSEEIASEAISKGVTDYLQKEMGTSQYSVLANRLCNAVEKYRARKTLEESEEKFSKMVVNSTDFISVVSEDARFEYVSPSAEHIIGYDPAEMVGDSVFDYVHPDDRQEVMEEFFAAVENPEQEPVVEFRLNNPDRNGTVVESRGKNLLEDDVIEGFIVNTRDITALKEREWELKEHNKKLEDMRGAISQDLRDPLGVATDSLALYRETGEGEHLERVEKSIDRIDRLLEQVIAMAECEMDVRETEAVSITEILRAVWDTLETDEAKLQVEDAKRFEADPSRLRQVFENLLRNAIEHSNGDVTIHVGTIDSGIYVEDTGPGIPEEDRPKVFESGYTTEPGNAGFGLNIVEQIVLGHGWDIDITEGEHGGTRFEITGITFHPALSL